MTLRFPSSGVVSLSGRNLDEGGSNGSGKSSVFLALRWCLFGQLGDEIILRGRTHTVVSVTFSVSDNASSSRYRVTRSRSRAGKGSLRIEVCGKRSWRFLPTRTIPAAQAWIEDTLASNTSLFNVSTLFSPSYGSSRFGQLTDAQRKQMIEQALGLERLDDIRDHFSRLLRNAENDLASNRSSAKTWLQVRESTLSTLKTMKRKADQWEKDGLKRVKKLSAQIEDVPEEPVETPALKGLELEEKKIRDKIREVETKLKSTTDFRMPYEIESDLKVVARDMSNVRSLIKKQVCPTCGQPTIGTAASNMFHDKVKDAFDKKVILEAELRVSKERKKVADALDVQSAFLHNKLNQVKTKIAVAKSKAASRKSDAERRNRLIQSEISDLQAQENPMSDPMVEEQTTFVEAGQSLLDAMRDRKKNKRFTAVYSFWKKGFGSKGVKSIILSNALSYLEQYATRWFKLFYPYGKISVRPTSMLKSGREVDKINVEVSLAESESVPYDSLSGGEKRRTDLALFFGWADFVTTFRGYRSSTWLMDEAFESLDAVGVACVLHAIRSSGRSGLVITHLPTLQESLKAQLQSDLCVVKQNGVSRLEGQSESGRRRSGRVEVRRSRGKATSSRTWFVKSLRNGGVSLSSGRLAPVQGDGLVQIKVDSGP